VIESPISFEIEVPTVNDFAGRIEQTLPEFPWLVAIIDNKIAGYAYACRHRERTAYQWSAEVSAYVAPNCHRSGIGRGLYLELFEILRRQGYFNAFAGIALPNDISVAFHESLGFKPAGVYPETGYKFNRWHDVGWWALRLREDSTMVTNPVPFSELDK